MDFHAHSVEVEEHVHEWREFKIEKPDGACITLTLCQRCDKQIEATNDYFSLRGFDPSAMMRRMTRAHLN